MISVAERANPAGTRRWTSVGLLLAQRWINIGSKSRGWLEVTNQHSVIPAITPLQLETPQNGADVILSVHNIIDPSSQSVACATQMSGTYDTLAARGWFHHNNFLTRSSMLDPFAWNVLLLNYYYKRCAMSQFRHVMLDLSCLLPFIKPYTMGEPSFVSKSKIIKIIM